jgi:choline dehydrogenase-like flavoprotein
LADIIIVGSGPAGTAAALHLSGRADVLMLDIGLRPPPIPDSFSGVFNEIFPDHPQLFEHIIGERFQSLSNITASQKSNLKLKSPYTEYIGARIDELTPIERRNFHGNLSLSRGGLANAWGAGAYRFSDQDLSEFPFGYQALEHYYDRLSTHIGICGDIDDLAPWFLQEKNLLPPLLMGRLAKTLLSRYQSKRTLMNQQGLFIGRGRLAVLSVPHAGRPAYGYEGMEFFRPENPAIYTPVYTLDQLERKGALNYRNGVLVERFSQHADYIEIHGRDIDSGATLTYRCRKLLLAAGTINTSRIVLRSHGDYQTRLPLMDNPLSGFPLFNLAMMGSPRDPNNASLTQLNLIYNQAPEHGTVQMSFYGANGPLRSDILGELPLPYPAARIFLETFQNSFGIIMCFYPGIYRRGSYLRLLADNRLEVSMDQEKSGPLERRVMALLRKLGYYSHPALTAQPLMGGGLHFAGTLPMTQAPIDYQCDPHGRLYGHQDIYVIDGACFPSLPAKNLTLTIMANAMRIADHATGQS